MQFDFEEFYNRLVEYKNKFGDCLVKTAYKCVDSYNLGQRVARIRSKRIYLSDEQKQKLDDLDFTWDTARLINFKEYLEHLTEYKNTFGNFNVPYYYTCDDGYKLGKKIGHIRRGEVQLSEEQKKMLADRGYTVFPKKDGGIYDDHDFDVMIKKLKLTLAKYDNALNKGTHSDFCL